MFEFDKSCPLSILEARFAQGYFPMRLTLAPFGIRQYSNNPRRRIVRVLVEVVLMICLIIPQSTRRIISLAITAKNICPGIQVVQLILWPWPFPILAGSIKDIIALTRCVSRVTPEESRTDVASR
jgi:hypothetical protein